MKDMRRCLTVIRIPEVDETPVERKRHARCRVAKHAAPDGPKFAEQNRCGKEVVKWP